MALKLVLLVSLAVVLMTTLTAEAQLGGLGGLGGLINGLFGSINVQGIVFCTADGNIGINGTATPVFPNALVQLQCGNGNVVASTRTSAAGVFSFALDPILNILSSLLSNCRIAVRTPLSNCNVNLPSVGLLQSNLQRVGDTLFGLLRIVNVIPDAFQFLPGLN